MSERLTRRNEQGVATFKRPVLCERCDEPTWSICDESGENITERMCDLEDLLCDESGKEVISLDELREIVQAQVTGCDLCHGEEAEHGFSIEDNELYYADTMNGNEGIKINYCPRCGRILPKRPAISVFMDAAICSGCARRGEEICGSCVRNGRGNDTDFYKAEEE